MKSSSGIVPRVARGAWPRSPECKALPWYGHEDSPQSRSTVAYEGGFSARDRISCLPPGNLTSGVSDRGWQRLFGRPSPLTVISNEVDVAAGVERVRCLVVVTKEDSDS